MNKKGFTLVELLAVIVILAVILVIAVPQINDTIDNTKDSAFISNEKLIATNAEKEYASRTLLGTLDQENNPITCSDIVDLSSENYDSCEIEFNNGAALVTIIGKGKFNGRAICNGTKNDAIITSECGIIFKEDSVLHGAYPRLDEGMIPVTIETNGTVKTVDPNSNAWYSYGDSDDADNTNDKRWANVVLVKETATEGITGSHDRTYYKEHYNQVVLESDILAYLVWIPRYKYQLFNVGGNQATYSNESCTANCPQLINITFEDSSTNKSSGTTNGTWLTHPAFTYDGRELNGIWVGKFETTGDATTPTIKPYVGATVVRSLRDQNVSTQFATSLKFGTEATYGLNMESRMSKNSEWGAVVYLSHSTYGINTQIRINNSDYLTGCGASTEDAAYVGSGVCQIKYGSITEYPQSTTGNIYGIFDMSGGAWEYVMGVLADSDGNPSGLYSGLCSGLCNLYNATNWTTNTNYLGEALGETSGWYKDYASFVSAGSPWFVRGGSWGSGVSAGGFHLYNDNGHAYSNVSFRVVLS